MPRVAGIYSRPTGIDAVANNTIDSGKYNSNVADVEADLNLPRPVVAGGTGASNALDARANIGAEVSSLQQIVTNYDTQVWESGSFASAAGATGAPTGAEHFMGVAVLLNATGDYINLRAVGNATGKTYTRLKQGGIWAAWTAETDVLNSKVAKTGDTMTGTLTLANIAPAIILQKAAGQTNIIQGNQGTTGTRWLMQIGNTATESGGNAGSNFEISRYSDLAAFIDSPLTIARSNGVTTIGYLFVANASNYWASNGTLAVSTKGYQPGGGTWGDSSDARIKTVLGAYEHGLAEIIAINPIRYTFKGNDGLSAIVEHGEPASPHAQAAADGTVYVGVVAQDIETVLPETVTQRPGIIDGQAVNDMRIYDSSALIYALVNACKELAARVDTLEAAVGTTPMATILQRLDVLDKFREKIEAL